MFAKSPALMTSTLPQSDAAGGVEVYDAAMRCRTVSSFEVLQYSGGDRDGGVFLARCKESVDTPLHRCVCDVCVHVACRE